MEQRLRMDVPTMTDPQIRDLFQESDLFVRSFGGVSSFGLLSPLDFIRILTLISELISHAWLLWSLTFCSTHLWLLLFSVLSSILPLIISCWSPNSTYFEEHHDVVEARAAAKQNRMHAMAYNEADRPEIVLFGLGPWILHTWAKARKVTLGIDKHHLSINEKISLSLRSQLNVTNILAILQNVRSVVKYDYHSS